MGEGIERLLGYAPREICPDLWTRIIKESIMLGKPQDWTRRRLPNE